MHEAILELKHSQVEENYAPGLGARLRHAREAAQLTIQDVAQHLRLKLAVISALENDEYQKLPAPMFVKGYLRMYASMLGLPADEIVNSYNRICQVVPAVQPASPGLKHQLSQYFFSLAINGLLCLTIIGFIAVSVRWVYLQYGSGFKGIADLLRYLTS